MSTNQKRQPPGTETGGQFATSVNPESTVDLGGIEGPRYSVSLRPEYTNDDIAVQSFEVGGLVEFEVSLRQSDFDSATNVAYNEDEATLLVELADGRIVSVEPGDVVVTEESKKS